MKKHELLAALGALAPDETVFFEIDGRLRTVAAIAIADDAAPIVARVTLEDGMAAYEVLQQMRAAAADAEAARQAEREDAERNRIAEEQAAAAERQAASDAALKNQVIGILVEQGLIAAKAK